MKSFVALLLLFLNAPVLQAGDSLFAASFREEFSSAHVPTAADFQPGQKWSCESVNLTKPKTTVKNLSGCFEFQVISLQEGPSGTSVIRSAGSCGESEVSLTSNKAVSNSFTGETQFRVTKDGRLVVELTLGSPDEKAWCKWNYTTGDDQQICKGWNPETTHCINPISIPEGRMIHQGCDPYGLRAIYPAKVRAIADPFRYVQNYAVCTVDAK